MAQQHRRRRLSASRPPAAAAAAAAPTSTRLSTLVGRLGRVGMATMLPENCCWAQETGRLRLAPCGGRRGAGFTVNSSTGLAAQITIELLP